MRGRAWAVGRFGGCGHPPDSRPSREAPSRGRRRRPGVGSVPRAVSASLRRYALAVEPPGNAARVLDCGRAPRDRAGRPWSDRRASHIGGATRARGAPGRHVEAIGRPVGGSVGTDFRTPSSARGCSSARARSSTTSARSLPSCRSVHIPSSSGRCPASSTRRSRVERTLGRRRRSSEASRRSRLAAQVATNIRGPAVMLVRIGDGSAPEVLHRFLRLSRGRSC